MIASSFLVYTLILLESVLESLFRINYTEGKIYRTCLLKMPLLCSTWLISWLCIKFQVKHHIPQSRIRFYLSGILWPWSLSFFFFNWRLIILQYCGGFAIHSHESAMGVHVFPIPTLPPWSLSCIEVFRDQVQVWIFSQLLCWASVGPMSKDTCPSSFWKIIYHCSFITSFLLF